MVNKAKKGYTKEKRARDELKEDRHFIAFKSIRWRFGCIDFAALFDIVAIKFFKEIDKAQIPHTGSNWRFISVKHFGKKYNNYLPHQKEIKEFKKNCNLKGNFSFELWIWHHPKWVGRGKNKHWEEGHWDKKVL